MPSGPPCGGTDRQDRGRVGGPASVTPGVRPPIRHGPCVVAGRRPLRLPLSHLPTPRHTTSETSSSFTNPSPPERTRSSSSSLRSVAACSGSGCAGSRRPSSASRPPYRPRNRSAIRRGTRALPRPPRSRSERHPPEAPQPATNYRGRSDRAAGCSAPAAGYGGTTRSRCDHALHRDGPSSVASGLTAMPAGTALHGPVPAAPPPGGCRHGWVRR